MAIWRSRIPGGEAAKRDAGTILREAPSDARTLTAERSRAVVVLVRLGLAKLQPDSRGRMMLMTTQKGRETLRGSPQ